MRNFQIKLYEEINNLPVLIVKQKAGKSKLKDGEPKCVVMPYDRYMSWKIRIKKQNQDRKESKIKIPEKKSFLGKLLS